MKIFDIQQNLSHNTKSIKLTTDIIHNSCPKEKLLINERLTEFKTTLFPQTRSNAKEKQYRAWISNTEILVKKNENSKIIKIKSSQDVENV